MTVLDRIIDGVKDKLDKEDFGTYDPEYISDEAIRGWSGTQKGLVSLFRELHSVKSATYDGNREMTVVRKDGEEIKVYFNKSNAKFTSSSNTRKQEYPPSLREFIEAAEDEINMV